MPGSAKRSRLLDSHQYLAKAKIECKPRDTLNKACYGLNCVRQVGKWANGAVPDLPSGLQPLAICLLSRAIGGWAQP